ncbi:MAG: sulfotransferase [Gammaproteobacteria bacterium]|jgi:tetratricopeptide (TPR) repeat protein
MKSRAETELRHGLELFARGRLDEAGQVFSEVVAKQPDNAHAQHLLASVQGQTGQLDAALDGIRRAIRLAPNEAAFHCTLGHIHRARGETEPALHAYRQATGLAPEFAEAWFHQGRLLRQSGEAAQAVRALKTAFAHAPGVSDIIVELARAEHASGDSAGALQRLKVAAGNKPDNPALSHTRALILLECERFREAADAFATVVEARPDYLPSLRGLAAALERLGELEAARTLLEKALPKHAAQADLWNQLAQIRHAQTDYQGAEQAYREALERTPLHAEASAGLAELLEWQGEYDKALALLDALPPAVRQAPAPTVVRSRVLRRKGRAAEALPAMEALIDSGTLSPQLESRAQFTLGDLLDACGEWDRAFAAYTRANTLKAVTFDHAAHEQFIIATKRAFNAQRMAELPAANATPGAVPVLIVGMPRSGTSLVEQILAAHPAVTPLGERPTLGMLSRQLLSGHPAGPEGAVADLDLKTVQRAAADYLVPDAYRESGIAVVTDKMPPNFLHLGLAQLLLPHARIVHCMRNPGDTALSCYFTDFVDPALAFATRLDGIARYLCGYRDLMAHWKAHLELPVLDLEYEQLVRSPRETVARLLDFLGLPWDEACFTHERQARSVKTASHAQVRRPLYTSSVNRHRHYARHLAEFIGRLDGNGD